MKQRSIAPKEAVELASYLAPEALRAAGRPSERQGASSTAEAARGMAAVCQSEFALDFIRGFRIVPDGQDDYLTGFFEDRKQYLVI